MKTAKKFFLIFLIIGYYFCLGTYPGHCRAGGRGSGKGIIGRGGNVSRAWKGGGGHKTWHKRYYYQGGYYFENFGYIPYFPYYGTLYPYSHGYDMTPPRNGEASTYYPDGKIASVTSWKDGKLNGTAHWYYENGALQSETSWKDGRLDGICRWYYPNGQLMAEGSWQDGRQHGSYTWYYESGMLQAEAHWQNGSQLSATCYDENGHNIRCRQE